jgi:transcriptional regulator GlxA family with amidase domain
MPARNVAILLFEGVEVLDFCGPLEVFSVSGQEQSLPPFHVYTVAETAAPIRTINGLSVNPAFEFSNCPPPHILIVPGGQGTRKQIYNAVLLDWISDQAKQVELLISVCTGALLLGKAGLLDGLSATTHHSAIALLKEIAPKATVLENKRIVDNGKIVLSAGISAGIDLSLHVVRRLLGPELAAETAAYMEYDWRYETRGGTIAN